MLKVKKSAFFIIFCVVGCMYQVARLTQAYMAYEVTSDVKFTTEPFIKLPAMTLCFLTPQLINWSHAIVRRDCDKVFGVNCRNMSEPTLVNLYCERGWEAVRNLSEKLLETYDGPTILNITIPITALIELVRRLDDKESPWKFVEPPLEQLYDVTEFLSLTVKCFTLNWKPEWAEITRAAVMKGGISDNGFYSSLSYSQSLRDRSDALYFFYSDNRFKDIWTGTFQDTPVRTKGVIFSSYDLFKSHLLEQPFASQCLDYASIGMKSQAECSDLCMERGSVALLGKKWFGLRLTFKDEGIMSMPRTRLVDNWTLIMDIRAKCEQDCWQQDCYQEAYIVRTRASNLWLDINGHGSFTSGSPTFETESLAKFTFAEYLLLASSCVGFWFGLSVLDGLKSASYQMALFKARINRRLGAVSRLHGLHGRAIGPISSPDRTNPAASRQQAAATSSIVGIRNSGRRRAVNWPSGTVGSA